jgi:solute carrier family 25 phosphate transporter 3
MLRLGLALFHLGVAASLNLDPSVFFAGGLAASFSHTVAVPVDYIKTRQQSEPERYGGSAVDAARLVVADEGLGALLGGAGPTLSGYFVQGSLKYGLYDAFKPEVSALLGAASPLAALMLSGIAAECIASSFLCPLEAARIKTVSDPSYRGLSTLTALQRLVGGERGAAAAFEGLAPCLLKMVPCKPPRIELGPTPVLAHPKHVLNAHALSPR